MAISREAIERIRDLYSRSRISRIQSWNSGRLAD